VGKGQNMILPANYLEFAASDNNGRDDQLERQQYLIESMTLNIIGFRSSYTFLRRLIHSKIIYIQYGKVGAFQFCLKIDKSKRRGY
jgi:hypothetical protein